MNPLTNERVLILGGPLTGKSQLAADLLASADPRWRGTIRCTDSVIEQFEWSQASLEVATWVHAKGPWIIEGTIVVRALRHWLLQTRMTEKPADIIYCGTVPFSGLTPNQKRLLDGCNTIWNGIRGEVQARGVMILPIRKRQVMP